MAAPETLQSTPELEQLLQLAGIADSFLDYAGDTVHIPLTHRLRTLQAMGLGLHHAGDVLAQLQDLQTRPYSDPLEPAAVLKAGIASTITLALSPVLQDTDFHWQLLGEDQSVQQGEFNAGSLPQIALLEIGELTVSLRSVSLPVLPAGYFRLQLSQGQQHWESLLIVAPERCHEPDWMQAGRHPGGLSLQLYSLRSARNWGMGDFGDLQELIVQAAQQGLDFIVLNPLHALDLSAPEHCSPYSPMDRRFLNPLYIALDQEAEYVDNSALQQYLAKPALQARLAEMRSAELVDYASVARLKLVVLGKMYRQFCKTQLQPGTSRGQQFRDWCQAQGKSLDAFAGFEAARHRFSLDQTRHSEFHKYLQWLADRQLQNCQKLASEQGMAIGLVRDLAVGGNDRSAEVQLNPGLFCLDARIGAPPDPLAPQGQNWGLPPLDPWQLQRTAFRHFRELLDRNMSHCGALRIDHVMSLMRLWWCPGDDHSGAGAYVHYPVDALFAILRLESQRHGCVVVGEDLGVVPPEIRRHMADSAVISNVLFYFEKYDGVHFKQPAHFPQRALAMIANHDVPTLAAWWNKSDLELRQRIGLFAAVEQLEQAKQSRAAELQQVLYWLRDQALLPEAWQDMNTQRRFDHALCQALLQANGRSAALLVSLQLEDLLLEQSPVNIPGTFGEYPNWRRKLTATVEQLFSQPESRTMLDAFVQARKTS